jgi:CRP-like cAMP-binding protein
MAKSAPPPAPVANRLLSALPRPESARLLRRLVLVPLGQGEVLYEAGKPIPFVYFPENGLVSIVAPMGDGQVAETGMVGKEGVVGIPLFLGKERAPFRAVVQIPAEARRMEAAAFQAAAKRDTALADLLARYLATFLAHVGQSAACNSHHSVEKRCCRWLLLARDRLGKDEFPLTHEFMAAMLGVRRTGVTEVAGALQRRGLIRYSRGRLAIVDPAGLEAASCACYRVIKAEFDAWLS